MDAERAVQRIEEQEALDPGGRQLKQRRRRTGPRGNMWEDVLTAWRGHRWREARAGATKAEWLSFVDAAYRYARMPQDRGTNKRREAGLERRTRAMRKEDSEKAKRQAQEREQKEQLRLQALHWRQPTEDTVTICIRGDSKLVVEWLCGRWKIRDRSYKKKVAMAQNRMQYLFTHLGARTRDLAADPWEHVRRECNRRADELTHRARLQGSGESWTMPRSWPTAILIHFDGGTDTENSAGAWTLATWEGQAWHTQAEAWWSYDDICTVTSVEIDAATAATQALDRYIQACRIWR